MTEVSEDQSLAKARRSLRRDQMVLASFVVVVVLVVVVGGAWVLIAQPFSFHQQITMTSPVTSIAVGTGVDSASGKVRGEAATFHVGVTVYVVFTVSRSFPEGSDEVLTRLKPGLEYETGFGLPIPAAGVYSVHAPVGDPGTYQWAIGFVGGEPGYAATITFQVVS
jgi:hypothetical protein